MYIYVQLVPRRPAPTHAATRSATQPLGARAMPQVRVLAERPCLRAAAWRAQRPRDRLLEQVLASCTSYKVMV